MSFQIQRINPQPLLPFYRISSSQRRTPSQQSLQEEPELEQEEEPPRQGPIFFLAQLEYNHDEDSYAIVPYSVQHIPRSREVSPLRFVYVSSHNAFIALHPNFVSRYTLHRHATHSARSSTSTSTSRCSKEKSRMKGDMESISDETGTSAGAGAGAGAGRAWKKAKCTTSCSGRTCSTTSSSERVNSHFDYDPVEKVLYTHGLLHHILTFATQDDVLCVSLVNRYFFKVSRSDVLWKELCILLWKEKLGMPLLRKNRTIAPFWRTFVKPHVVESMSIRDIKMMFAERPMMGRRVRSLLMNSLEKRDMQAAVLELMPKEGELGGDKYGMEDDQRGKVLVGFNHLWFGCYASSVVDSKRSFMALEELLSKRGFLMHFKVIHEDMNVRGGHDVEISLHFHCKCFFDEEDNGYAFRMEDSEDPELHHPQGLSWKWVVDGKAVQIGFYPALVVHRLDNWGWKLENQHVVLLSQ
jgi:hypothetical protein